VSLEQLTSVLLLVNKDPGVLVVWAGFVLLSVGLYISFFMSHRRIWVCVSAAGKGTRVVIGGSSNKNRPGFEKLFSKLSEQVSREL
jgi:cytochrome c biogenesis protein